MSLLLTQWLVKIKLGGLRVGGGGRTAAATGGRSFLVSELACLFFLAVSIQLRLRSETGLFGENQGVEVMEWGEGGWGENQRAGERQPQGGAVTTSQHHLAAVPTQELLLLRSTMSIICSGLLM